MTGRLPGICPTVYRPVFPRWYLGQRVVIGLVLHVSTCLTKKSGLGATAAGIELLKVTHPTVYQNGVAVRFGLLRRYCVTGTG